MAVNSEMRRWAHFCMPLRDLRLPYAGERLECAYNHKVDDLIRLREALRRAREHAPIERDGVPDIGMTLDEAEERSGLNRATIHSIENVKREPTLKVRLQTIARLARAYGLSLSFAPVEELSAPASVREDQDRPVPNVSADAHAAVPSLTFSEEDIQILTQVIKDYSDRDATRQRRADRRHAATTGDDQTASDRSPRTNRQGNARKRKRVTPRHK